MSQKVLKHKHEWEYVECKGGETTYKCKDPDCKGVKISYHDSGCGG